MIRKRYANDTQKRRSCMTITETVKATEKTKKAEYYQLPEAYIHPADSMQTIKVMRMMGQ